MAGHNKWTNIKNRKGAQDKKKAKIFGWLSKQIRTAVKEGRSGDPSANPTLRLYLEKARDANMPKENIKRAIDKGLGKGGAGVVSEITYEGFGPGGIGMMVTVATDNVNRVAAELKNTFSTAGGNLGAPGSVAYMFERSSNGEEGYVCTMPIPVTDKNIQSQIEELIERLSENEDVEEVLTAGVWAEQE